MSTTDEEGHTVQSRDITGEEITLGATAVLQQSWGEAFQLDQPALISDRGRNQVFRCRVQGPGTLPATVIVKRITNPQDPIRGVTDWASLAFLSQLADNPPVAPRCYGGDAHLLLYVMEDVGNEGSLDLLLHAPDTARAIAMCGALAQQMGRLHAITMGKERQFALVCADLSPAGMQSRATEAERWLADAHTIEDWCDALSYQPPTGFAHGCQQVAETYAHPGAWLAFTHGDPAPTNNHLRGDAVYLLDFEYAGYRHALYDLTGWNILCPLPTPCVELMSQQLRMVLAPTCPEVGDDVQYRTAWATLCTYRAMALLSWMPLHLIDHNLPWADTWNRRDAIVVALSRWEQATRGVLGLEVMSEVAAQLFRRFQALWPDSAVENNPLWPAFH